MGDQPESVCCERWWIHSLEAAKLGEMQNSSSSYGTTEGKLGLVGDMDLLQQNKFISMTMVDGKQDANLASWNGGKWMLENWANTPGWDRI